MSFLNKPYKQYFLGFIVWIIYKLLSLTWRVKLIEPPEMVEQLQNQTPFILAHFHGDEIPLIQLAGRYKIATMTSTSKDGEIMNTVLRLLGGRTSRGSSTRGGVSALKGLIQLCKRGANCSVAVDGPKGPIYEVKPGIFELARLMKAPIYAGSVSCDKKWVFEKAWNKAFLPKPFSRVVILWHRSDIVLDRETDPRSPELAEKLKSQIFDAKSLSSKYIVP